MPPKQPKRRRLWLLVFGAAFVAYGINRFAVQQGAPLAAIGSRADMAASLISALAVGAGLSISTFAGLTLAEVDRLQLKAYAQDQSEAIAAAPIRHRAQSQGQSQPGLDR